MTKKAITADKTATSLALLAIAKATEAAKINGKLLNKPLPTFDKMTKHWFKNVPLPIKASKCNIEIVASLVKDCPIARKKPAIGNKAIGNIKLRPIRCKTPKILAFISSLFHPVLNIYSIIISKVAKCQQ